MTALIRLSDVYEIPATNIGSAEILLRGVEAGFADFREVIHEGDRRPLAFENNGYFDYFVVYFEDFVQIK